MVSLGSPEILEVVCSPRLRYDSLSIALLSVASNAIYDYASLAEQGALPSNSKRGSYKDLFMEELQRQKVEIPSRKQMPINMAVNTLAERVANSRLSRVYLELEKATIGLAALTNRERLIREGKTPIIYHPDSDLTVDYLTLESTPEEVATALARTLALEGRVLKVGVIYPSIEEFSRGLQGKRIKIRDQYRSIR